MKPKRISIPKPKKIVLSDLLPHEIGNGLPVTGSGLGLESILREDISVRICEIYNEVVGARCGHMQTQLTGALMAVLFALDSDSTQAASSGFGVQ